jgi:hypothetical protein
MTPLDPIVASRRDKPGIIYIAKNKVNGKCYVGQTSAKKGKTHKGFSPTAETRAKISATTKGKSKPWSPARKAAHVERWTKLDQVIQEKIVWQEYV